MAHPREPVPRQAAPGSGDRQSTQVAPLRTPTGADRSPYPAWTGTPAEAPLRSRSQPGRERTGTDAGVLKPADGAREVEVVLGGCVPRSRSICSSRRGLDDAERAADATRIEARGHDPHVCVHDWSLGVCCDSQPASPSPLSVRTLLGGRPTHRRAVTSVGCWLWSLRVSRTGRAGSRRQAAG